MRNSKSLEVVREDAVYVYDAAAAAAAAMNVLDVDNDVIVAQESGGVT